MDDSVRRALGRGHLIDITTIGRRSGKPRRLEIGFHVIDGRIYISGMPVPGRTRGWIHNLTANPRLTIHLKGAVVADVPATARIITDEAERRAIFEHIVRIWKRQDVETMTDHSPLIEVSVEDAAA